MRLNVTVCSGDSCINAWERTTRLTTRKTSSQKILFGCVIFRRSVASSSLLSLLAAAASTARTTTYRRLQCYLDLLLKFKIFQSIAAFISFISQPFDFGFSPFRRSPNGSIITHHSLTQIRCASTYRILVTTIRGGAL